MSNRLFLINASFYLLFLVILSKLFFIQIISHKSYQAKAEAQHWSSKILLSKRGDILAKDGYPLATSKVSYLVFAEPKRISDIDNFTNSLVPILVDESTISANIKADHIKAYKEKLDPNLFWVPLEKHVPIEKKLYIESLQVKGVGFEPEYKRFYPEGTLASHVLGFIAGSDRGEPQGYFGIEGYFNGDLKGKEGKILEEKSASGESILIGGYKKLPPMDGRSIKTTIHREIQFAVEQKLKDGVEKYKALSGSVIIIEPFTGDIIAMANYPTFDPLDPYKDETDKSIKIERKNISIADTYEPGSIIKPLTVAAAIDLGLVSPDTTFDDKGTVSYSGHNIDNWNGKHHGIQTITQLLEKSNNIGASWVGTKVGSKNLFEYFKKFGLGELSGITLEGENTGILRNYSDWRDIDTATISFGQGMSASILQMAIAFCTFENGGYLVKPRIISEIIERNRVIEVPVVKKRQVISIQTSKTVSSMLVSAVANGEARFFNIKGYSVAGKTGTAQIPVGGKYDPNKTNATFVGFLPHAPKDKKFVMIVRLEQPNSSIYAAETAVPLWMDILKDLVVVNKIPPDKI